MRSDREGKPDNEVGMELKYCEHCGGLYVRERGVGVYCNNCLGKVADLPRPHAKRTRVVLPVHPQTAVEQYAFEIDVDELGDFEAAGGMA